jgi:hypothetical protein
MVGVKHQCMYRFRVVWYAATTPTESSVHAINNFPPCLVCLSGMVTNI